MRAYQTQPSPKFLDSGSQSHEGATLLRHEITATRHHGTWIEALYRLKAGLFQTLAHPPYRMKRGHGLAQEIE